LAGTLTVAPATATAAAGTIALTGVASLTVGTAAAPAQGEDVTLDAAALFTIAVATATAQGETVGLLGQGALAVTPTAAPADAAASFLAAANLTLDAATAAASADVTLVGIIPVLFLPGSVTLDRDEFDVVWEREELAATLASAGPTVDWSKS
jgi:hypothetical protein